MKAPFLNTLHLVERLHRQCLEIAKAELERLGIRNLSSVQAIILFNIGDERLTVSELTRRGYYLGSNVSYNAKKLIETGFLTQERCGRDRRVFYLRATDAGLAVAQALNALFEQHAEQGLKDAQLTEDALVSANAALARLHHLWNLEGRQHAPLPV